MVEDTKVVFTCDAKTGFPFKVSLIKTLEKPTPPVEPLTGFPVSSFAIIVEGFPITFIVTIAVSQFEGFTISQIW